MTGSGLRNTVARAIPIVGDGHGALDPVPRRDHQPRRRGPDGARRARRDPLAIYLPAPAFVVVVASLILRRSLAGGLWAAIPALGQTWLQLPILISSLLLNYPARALTSYLVRFRFADPR